MFRPWLLLRSGCVDHGRRVRRIMARPSASEIPRLAETFAWAATADLKPMRQAIRAVGSGDSLTAAHALAGLHQRWEAATAPLWARPTTITAPPRASALWISNPNSQKRRLVTCRG